MALTNHSACTVEALFRVFVAPALRTTTRPRRQPPTLSLRSSHSRLFSTTPPQHLARPSRPAEPRAQKWNSEISHRIITLIDPATNQPEAQPRRRFDVLRTLDEKTHRLVQLTPDPTPDVPADFIPLCKIVSKKDEYDRERARKAQLKDTRKARALEGSVKTLELNWAAAANDLAHRLEKVREFLEEGRKVEVVLAVKKRGRRAGQEECQEVLRQIRKVVDGVEGAREVRAMEGNVGAFATLSFQGKPPPRVGKKEAEREEAEGGDVVEEQRERAEAAAVAAAA